MRTIKSFTHYFSIAAFVGVASTAGHAATIWNGPIISYNQPAPDPSQPENRDPLTSHVALTRGATQGVINGVTESFYTHDFSPADTAWAVGELADYQSLTYASWETTGNGRPVMNLPGLQLVCHLLTDDIYLSVKFLYLGDRGPGLFYERSTPSVANPPPVVSITSPTNGTAFAAPAVVSITATATDDGSVTNVSFFDGITLLGSTNNTPYSIAANLSVGAHPLTAVATDNLGLSATSSVVNVTINSAAPPVLTATVVGNNLDITWQSAGPRLQSQINNPGAGLGTNWSDVGGSTATNHVIVPLDRAKGSVFYRLFL